MVLLSRSANLVLPTVTLSWLLAVKVVPVGCGRSVVTVSFLTEAVVSCGSLAWAAVGAVASALCSLIGCLNEGCGASSFTVSGSVIESGDVKVDPSVFQHTILIAVSSS